MSVDQATICVRCPSYLVKMGEGPWCSANQSFIKFYEAYSCPVGPWAPLVIYQHQPNMTPVPMPQPDPERAKARSFWESLAALPGQAVQMAQVMASGTAPDDVVAARHASCGTCPARKDAQSKPVPPGAPLGENQWCGDCGCGTKPWAKLDKKLTYAYLPCPRKRPGFSNAHSE